MSFLVTARKYRPSTFHEVVAQGHVVNTLLNSIRLGRIAHAYLFSGPRGVGKTTTARIFAKALNCPNAKEGEPCNACDTVITSYSIHYTKLYDGSRVWYPRDMCYDCHGRGARFDPYGADCPRYTVRLARNYDYWWAYDYHPVSTRFVYGGRNNFV